MSSLNHTAASVIADTAAIDKAQSEIRSVCGRIIGFLSSNRRFVPPEVLDQIHGNGLYLGQTLWSIRRTADGLVVCYDPTGIQSSHFVSLIKIEGPVPLASLVRVRGQLQHLLDAIVRIVPRIADELDYLADIAKQLRQ